MRAIRLAMALVLAAACTVDIGYDGTEYQCPDGVSCPPGFDCVQGVCRPQAPDAAVTIDAALHDAAPFDALATDASAFDAAVVDAAVVDAAVVDAAPVDAALPDAEWADSGLPDDDDLLLHWKLDENSGSTIHDATPNNRDGMRHGAAWVAGYFGGALSFGGSLNDFADDEDSELYLNGLTAFTVTMWVKSNEIDSDRGMLICNVPDGRDTFLSLRYDASGEGGGGSTSNVIKAGIRTSGGVDTDYESAGGVQTLAWQFLALTWESGTPLRLFIDGVEDTPSYIGGTSSGAITQAEWLYLGKGGQDTSSSWNGLIDDFRIYDRVLLDSEIQALYAVPTTR